MFAEVKPGMHGMGIGGLRQYCSLGMQEGSMGSVTALCSNR